jgi:hypothetical protein
LYKIYELKGLNDGEWIYRGWMWNIDDYNW